MTNALLPALCCVALLLPQHPATPDPNKLRRIVEAPGVVQIQDSLFLDRAEITNLGWQEYLHFVQRDSSAAFYQSQLPDSAAQPIPRSVGGVMNLAGQSYFRFPAYRQYPVVGITQAQAAAYCRWRTAIVARLLNPDYVCTEGNCSGPEAYHRQHRALLRDYVVTATYRLPTPAEWELAAEATTPPGGLPRGPVLAEAYSRLPNPLGFYNLPGNVSELTATPGVAKGGSWLQPDVGLGTLHYQGPQPWLGFRCACEVQVTRKARL